MKTIKNLSVLLSILVIASSCGSSDSKSLSKLKEELSTLKSERKTLNEKIANLEVKITALDTSNQTNSKAKLVRLENIVTQPFTNYIEIMGQVDADQNTNVSPEVPGTLERIYVKAGQRVTVGQTLGQIDNTVSEVAMNEVKTQISFAKTVYDKQKNLWDQKIGTEMQYLSAKNNYESLQKRLATMNQQLGMARIKAPISGIVDEVYVKEGQTVAPGLPCFRVVNTSELKVKAKLSEFYAGKVSTGNKVQLFFPDLNKNIQAEVGYVSKVIDKLTRSFNIEIPIKSGTEYKPNMMSKIKIVDYYSDSAIVVPVNNIRTLESESFIMIAEEKNGGLYAKKQPVSLGVTYNGMTEIKSGLVSGDRIISVGYQELENGDLIKL